MGSIPNPLRIAILMNSPSPLAPDVVDSFREIIAKTGPQAEVAIYDPIVKQQCPDTSKYDLVILSGGTVDPMLKEPWVLKMMDFIRRTDVAQRENRSARAKLLGICWGHQAICIAFGGVVETMDRKPDLGPMPINLIDEGKKLFKFAATEGSHMAMEFHRRAITKAASGFVPLSEDNELFQSNSNMILTTQSHPEMKGPLAVKMLKAAPTYTGELNLLSCRASKLL